MSGFSRAGFVRLSSDAAKGRNNRCPARQGGFTDFITLCRHALATGDLLKHVLLYFMEINLIGFLPALLPVALTPGASFTLVMSSALSGGRRGLFNTLAGTALGIYTHALLIGLGISAVIVTVPALFAVLKIAGALWLLWLGGALIRSGMKARQGVLPEAAQPVSLRGAWTANILNPKAIIFYLTVVSQFAGQQGGVSHYLMLASVHVIVMSLWLVAVSQVLVFSATKTDTLVLKKVINMAGGVLLIVSSLHSLFC